jgi:hypothetical protein
MQYKVWFNPKPPSADNNNWEFLVTITAENRERKQVKMLVPDQDLQQLFLANIGRPMRQNTDTEQSQELDTNWDALQETLNRHAEKALAKHLPDLGMANKD